MVPMPIPETYTVPQSYQPRRPEGYASHTEPVPGQWQEAADYGARATQGGPIPFASHAAASSPAPSQTRAPAQSGREPVGHAPRPASAARDASESWNHYLAAGAFLAAGALLATGHRRLGIAAAAAGAATVLLDDQELVATLCERAPTYLAEAQSLVSQAEELLRTYFPATGNPRA